MLTPTDVHAWFVAACRRGAVPEVEQLQQFAAHLNFLSGLKLTLRAETPSEILEYRAAVRKLRRAVPPIIARAEQVLKNYQNEYDASEWTTSFHEERLTFEKTRLERLRNIMRALDEEPMGTPYKTKTPAWHSSAHSIAWFVDVAFRSCGRRGADFNTLSSPAIQVMISALDHLGLKDPTNGGTLTADAIRACLVRRPR